MLTREEQLQERLRRDDRQALKEVYLSYKPDFLAYFQSKGVEKGVLEDLYHEAVVALHQNFVVRQLHLKKANLKSYLFAIGKNKLMQLYKSEKKIDVTATLPEEDKAFDLLDQQELQMDQKRLLAKAFQELGEKCRELIKLYYYRGFTIKEMVEATPYKDENTVKSYKSRCLKKLKESIRISHG